MENGDDRHTGQFGEVAMSETPGCEDCINDLLGRLKVFPRENEDDDLRVISVVETNLEATGKTALARSVYDHPDVKRRFDCRAWICVEENSSVADVLVNILRQIPKRELKDVDSANETELSLKLHEYFFAQRYLVVLDNINRVDLMSKLLTFLIDSGNGSRVIITTHNVNMPYLMDPWIDPIKFHSLTEEDDHAGQFNQVAVTETLGREDCLNNLLHILKVLPRENDDDLRVISVVNMEATEKTALARSVYANPDLKHRFDCKAWIHVQDKFSVADVLANILRQISTCELSGFDSANEIELSLRLHKYFLEQRYLVVLDNINRVDLMAELLTFLIDSSNGSRVIITTRNVNLPYLIDPWIKPIVFHPLTEEDRRAGQFNKVIVSKTVGHKEGINNLLRMLDLSLQSSREMDDDLRVISVVNTEATGKTSLVRSVYGRSDVKNKFPFRAWIRMEDNYSIRDVLANILRQISMQNLRDFDLADENELYRRLCDYFFKQRYLIVLDNMNSIDLMVKLLTFLVDSNNSSRVIITTRTISLPYHIDPLVDPITFCSLTKEDRKQLLTLCLNKSEPDRKVCPAPSLLMPKILSWSRLSPAGIWLLGGFLSVTREERFGAMIVSLEKSPSVMDIVSLCYDELSKELQHCIMYVCQFPKEYEIPTRRLLRLWLAQGLVPTSGSGSGIQDAVKCFKELVRRNMIHVVSQGKGRVLAKTCCMPGFIYDYLLQKASEKGFFQTCGNDSSTAIPIGGLKFVAPWIVVDKARRSLETQEQSNSTQYSAKQVSSFISFNTKKIRIQNRELDIFLNPTKESSLVVLDLEGVYKPVLPNNLGYVLLNLKYLGLRWTILHKLPKSVGNLPQLETLDVKHTNITEVPRSIWTRKSLRHLYLNEVSFDKCITYQWRLLRSSKLSTSLQTLCGLHIKGKSPMLNILRKLTNITKLSLTCPSTLVREVIKPMSHMTTLQSLRLKSKDMLGQPSELPLQDMTNLKSLSNLYLFGGLQVESLSFLPQNLKSLTLSMSFLTKDPAPYLGKLEQLIDLGLYGHSYDGTTLEFNRLKFPSLCTLRLWKLGKLQSLILEEEAMPCLEELDIRDCQRLEKIHIKGNRMTLKEVSLAKVQKKLAESLQETFLRPFIVATE